MNETGPVSQLIVGQVTHEVGRHMPDWSLDAEHGGIIVLGSTDVDSRVQIGGSETCPHFAPMAISSVVAVRCRRLRGHDGAHEVVMVWLP